MTIRWLWCVVATIGCDAELAPRDDGTQLSDEGLYDDIESKLVTSDAIEIRPQYALWSDGAEKQRWMILPPGSQIDSSDMDHWQLPIGAKLFKEFTVAGQRVETRVIERVGAAEYRFAPYLWLADGSDAVLVPEGAEDVLGTQHDIPGQDVCITCHRSEPGRSLGVSAVQLSDVIEQLPLSQPATRRYPIPNEALGVLHANCGHCHTDAGIAPMQQLRFSTADAALPLEQSAPYRTTVGVPLTDWKPTPFTMRIVPGDPDLSAIYYRMSSRDPGEQMPPLATELADEVGMRAVRDWITSL